MDGFGRLAVLGAAALLSACGDASSEAPPDAALSETATSVSDPATPVADSFAELPVGDPPVSEDIRPGTEIPAPVDGLEAVWLTPSAVVALESGGTLVVLGDAEPADAEGDRWRGLTDERSPLGLPEGVTVDSVVAESRRTVLVDATDGSGRRAWVRCHVGLLRCAVAGELGAGDVVAQ